MFKLRIQYVRFLLGDLGGFVYSDDDIRDAVNIPTQPIDAGSFTPAQAHALKMAGLLGFIRFPVGP